MRTETHRGLEGRALAGFATGGRTFGYTTKPEEGPRDPEHPRKVTIIDEGVCCLSRNVTVQPRQAGARGGRGLREVDGSDVIGG